jgi:hypothetical protein
MRALCSNEQALLAMRTDRLDDLIQSQVFLPLAAVQCVIARPRAVQAKESGEAVCAQFPLQYRKSVPLELLVRQLIQSDHMSLLLIQDSGFQTALHGAFRNQTHQGDHAAHQRKPIAPARVESLFG